MLRSAKLAPILALALAVPADAGLFRRCHRPRPRPCAARHAAPAAATASRSLPPPPAATLAPRGGPAAHGDFLGWLNATRARHGLGPVGWDGGLASDAAANSSRGFGHNAPNPGRQNVGMGSLESVSQAWLASPLHAAALLDPSIRAVGLANVGGVWTFNGR